MAFDWQQSGNFAGDTMKVHKSLTVDRVLEAAHRQGVTLDNPGFCIACGHEQDGCEPDARNYKCEACGERKVFGAAELLMVMV
jgi:hypothetical protein